MGDKPFENSQILKGLCELALLSLLQGRAHYGIEILQRLRADAGIDIADGTIYPLLHRLAKADFVRSEWVIDEAGGRPRKYYELTPVGRAELALQVEQWQRLSGALNRFLSRTGK